MTLPLSLEQNESAPTLAPTQLLERGAEIAALEALLDATRSGDGRFVVVEGSAGIGKTRLLAEARTLAQGAEFEVLTARGGELEGEFAFGIVRQLFEAPLAAAAPELRTELLSGAAGLSRALFASAPTAIGEGAESSFAMLHGLYWLTANFAARKPTLLVVDDLHWADEASLRWLVYLARRLEGLPLLLLTGTRPPDQANLPALVGELLMDPVAAVIRPGVLGRKSAAALARERLGNEPAEAFAAALETGSGGNPLYLVALLDAVMQQGLEPTVENAPHVLELGPRAVSYGVATRLGRLGGEATDLLRAAAILGDRTDLTLAAALAGTDSATALTAAGGLVRADLLRNENPLEFTHPVVRTAVLESLSAAERARAHRGAAEAILDAGGRPEQAATHLVLTVPSGDDSVVAMLRRAAAEALAQGAAPAAAAYLRRALVEPPRREERARVLYELGIAELQSGTAESSRHLCQAIDELDDAASSPEIVLAYSHATEVAGQISPSILDLLRRTSVRAREADLDLHWRIEGQVIIAAHFDSELYALIAEQLSSPPGDSVKGGGGAGVLLAAWASEETRRGVSRERAVEYAKRALQSALHYQGATFLAVNYLYALTYAGEVEVAARGYEAAIELAQTHGDVLSLAILYLFRARLRAEMGDLRAAEEDLRPIERMAFQDAAVLQPYWAGYLAEVLLERGELAEAQRLVERLPALAQQGHFVNFYRVRGLVAFRAGSPKQALADFRVAGDLARSLRIENPAFAPWRSEAALALNRLDRQDEARELAREELELSQRWGAARTVGISLRALGLVEGGRTGEQLLRQAVDVLADSPARLEYARALVDLGAALRRGNSRSEARQLLRQGVEFAHRCGASALVTLANEELAATGAHPRKMLLSGLDALTASERRVAHMAAEDLSNKEIAQALFVTVKTVEQHLGRVYRKLDISSRKQLGAALDGPADARTTA
jgi:DNA-binding CsgD family transcriptional regulator/Tfp pilus assembly protein PilF